MDGSLQNNRHKSPLPRCRSRPPIVAGYIRARVESFTRSRLDLFDLDERYWNDDTGAPAYPPTILLKVILFAYSRGINGSRSIERACREHVTFIALCGDQAPHFTTIAGFIQATLACRRQGVNDPVRTRMPGRGGRVGRNTPLPD
ncbi:MAG: transposase [Pseudomonadota bacterium]